MSHTPNWMKQEPTPAEYAALPRHVQSQAREYWEKRRPCTPATGFITDEPVMVPRGHQERNCLGN